MTALATRPDTRTVHWTERAGPVAVLWAVVFGALQLWFALGHAPRWELGSDLLIPGWGAVALCLAAGVLAGTHGRGSRRQQWAAVVASWAVAAGLLASGGVLLLDLVGRVLPGLGIPFQLVAFGSRAGAVTGAVLVGATALAEQRRLRGACSSCGRTEGWHRAEHTPRWAWWAAYLAVAGCLVRLLAQYVVGWGKVPYDGGPSLVLFEIGFVLAGVLLPLGLVHRWGRTWPGWVVPVAGRRVPRWLPLGPAVLISGGITAYFGTGLVQMIGDAFRGISAASGPFDAAFFWVAVPAYVVWGVGLGGAALSYWRRTRPPCHTCHRG